MFYILCNEEKIDMEKVNSYKKCLKEANSLAESEGMGSMLTQTYILELSTYFDTLKHIELNKYMLKI